MNNSVRRLTYGSWSEFKASFARDLAQRDSFPPGRYVFRGQQSAAWDLTSGFDRAYRHIAPAERHKVASRLLAEFQALLETYDIPGTRTHNESVPELQLMAVAQHYGLPTRLLDWSRSPYVAAFFAFSDVLIPGEKIDEPQVGIWALDTASSIWSREQGAEVVSVPNRIEARIRNQGGVFTVCAGAVASLEEYHERMAPSKPALFQFLVPSEEAETALLDLNAMDINHARLFPGYDGCARAARLRVAWGDNGLGSR
jgi:FRG domain